MILALSGAPSSADATAGILRPLLSFLSERQFEVVHLLVRKGAHLVEYGILGALNFRAVRAGRAGWTWRWAALAVAVALVVAVVDEVRQWFVPSRSGTPGDVFLDVTGAAAALLLWRLRYSWQS